MTNNFKSNNLKTIAYRDIIDLTHAIHPNIPIWPGDPAPEFETVSEIDKNGYFLRKFSMGEHSGTHINAPNSFDPAGASVDSYAPQSLVLPGIAIDLREQCLANPDYTLTIDDILNWERQHKFIAPGSLVLLYTGWQVKWNDGRTFFNPDEDRVCHFPGFGLAATQFLLEERSIAGIGIDTHGVDPGQDESFAVNKMVLQNQGIVLENLANLHLLPAADFTLAIGILRLLGGSGSPVSVLAFVA
ncbi:MAG: cyclase family protein [Microcoleus sp. PH2017_10_PVI_O_A]|uniref:cyclase family protein n=1 Tax=unclassified Microcoleus TaxID=2642155 RepID=UPI001DC3937D|nr:MULTISPECIES: cyclase family protein [unclassified Microcoleus]TAE81840.1 MAG: cyclase family protein [Oscillatoriales cyanobacterium]MCC3406915.1 cyclase family protein [Microcoleus sp. PH2017_10_PVI_O_A]MCC3461010.1 cyclase family protein [Microcoleus sp. PH2017_11_PCY_U_A]MCC3479529.1 cyclase family protein [Microcoleus sp. PH2017_12_PCY_D_A]MCC3529612.1 cyclase family protein [Microcoleus sp. PH2017_21_RUC_O_A]